jgi:hypothetical protein
VSCWEQRPGRLLLCDQITAMFESVMERMVVAMHIRAGDAGWPRLM